MLNMNDLGDKVPPQNIEAEQSVLGSILIEQDAIAKVVEILSPESFYRDAHKRIFRAAMVLYEKGEAVDLVTAAEELRRQGSLDASGGAAYLTSLANSVPTAANVEYYAKIVEEKAVLRNLIQSATQIVTSGYENKEDAEAVLDRAEQLIFDISQKRSVKSYSPLKSVLVDAFDKIEHLYNNKGGVTGVPTGFRELDMITSGLQSSEFIVVAARPSMGKTVLCLNIARNAAVNHNVPVVIFSLEMAKEQLAQRMLCAEAGVDGQRLRTGYLTESDWPKLSAALGRLSDAPVFIDDTPGISVMEMRGKARRIKAEHGLGLVVIDYMQLMQNLSRRHENRQQEISDISRSLKSLARELDVPVVALSQLSRAVESRQDKRPMLSDLRESGAIEQDADVVAFIYRDDYYNPESEKQNIAELIIAKQRNGPTGLVELYFHKELSRFDNLERQIYEQSSS
jgi:replicative DNA helicase